MDEIRDSGIQRRPHLTKQQRLPKCFKEVEKVIRSVKSCKSNYKTILANSRLRGSAHRKVYSLTVNVLKNYNYIQKIIDKIQLLEKEKYLRREIASILIYEMIFGNGTLPGESKVVTTIQGYENDIRYAHEALQSGNKDGFMTEINIPRYVRVHTLVTTVPYVIKDLESCGFKQIFYEENLPEEKYCELMRSLEKGSFLIDFHFKDVLVFQHSENLIYLDLYKNGHIFLQDKASYIPVLVLNPQPGCAVLDACAAPGMKTLHIASKMKNKGILIACERDKTRFESLKNMLDYGSVKMCKALCKDFKLIDPNDQAYSAIEYILLDPSCSGSGMVSRMDEVTDTEDSKNKERLMKLAGFQIILLKHALKFPSVKRVVYSTCSIHEEENEYVVHEALSAFNGTFKLVPAMPKWSHRGSENFEFGKLCIRTDPEKHLTNGFFVAMFERVDCDEHTKKGYFTKNYKIHEVHGAVSETLPYEKIGSVFKRQRKKSELESGYEKKIKNETPEGFLNNNGQKPEDCSSQKKKYEYHSQQLIHDTGNYNSQSYQKRERTDTLDMLNKDVDIYDGSNQNVNKQVNIDYVQEKNKKHKKKKKEKHSDECLYESNEPREDFPNMLSEPQQECSKLKENRDSLLSETEGGHTDVLKRKEKSEQKRHHNTENVSKDIGITKKLADVTSVHKKKKKKHSELGDINSLETHIFQLGSNIDSSVSIQGMLESNENTTEILSVKNKKQKKHSKTLDCNSSDLNNHSMMTDNDLSGSQIKPSNHSSEEILLDSPSKTAEYLGDKSKRKKSKKHKHHDKSTCAQDETISCAQAVNVNNTTDKTFFPNPELISDIQNDCLTVSKSKKCKSKKHKIKNTDDCLKSCDSNADTIPFAEFVQVDEKDLQTNEILLTVNSNQDDCVKKKKSKKHKKKKHSQDSVNYINETESGVILAHQNINSSVVPVISSACPENQEDDTEMGVKHEFDRLLSQSEKKLEDTLFCDFQPQKKKRKKSHSRKVSETVTG